ncbi:MAG: BMP family ABC transporter substrate-binding protein, partial [Turicibacter sp.]|nr:BMP family ABC transporter substrate-binding protein [Turicibacter sp.]
GTGEGDKGTTTNGEAKIKVGMMTDSGTIDDKSFNQGTWEGIKRYESEKGSIVAQYIQPGGEATQDYLEAANNLLTAGNEMIIAPGFKFEEAIGKLQGENPETKFVILDGEPEGGVAENSVAIYFAEQEAGFLAGIAAALETKTGKVGFIGGMVIPAVQKFGYGFVTGVAYANANLGTNVEVADYLYNGTFNDVAGGQAQAGGMYDKGIDVVFVAAGGVGNGVIAEAKQRAEAGDDVYVIGVDVDQYEDGIISDGSSVILTSAIKRIDNAAYDKIDELVNGTFTGGQVITMDAKNDGVGLPAENPNLSEATQQAADEAFELIKNGTIVVPTELDEVTAMLEDLGFDASHLNLSGN